MTTNRRIFAFPTFLQDRNAVGTAAVRKMLESGSHATVAEMAAAEKINASYIGRVLRLTLLAPDIVEAVLGGRQPAEVTLAVLMRPFPIEWTLAASSASISQENCELGGDADFLDGFSILLPAQATSDRKVTWAS